MKIGDLVRVKWSGSRSDPVIPCVIYSMDYGACKVYDPFDSTIRTMVTDRIELINVCRK